MTEGRGRGTSTPALQIADLLPRPRPYTAPPQPVASHQQYHLISLSLHAPAAISPGAKIINSVFIRYLLGFTGAVLLHVLHM